MKVTRVKKNFNLTREKSVVCKSIALMYLGSAML